MKCLYFILLFALMSYSRSRTNVSSSDGGGGGGVPGGASGCGGTSITTENPHLLLLFYLAQLFLRELFKSYRLIQVVPMDMSGYYGW